MSAGDAWMGPMTSPPRIPLVRPRDDRLIGGVCSGLAPHLGLAVLPVRIGMMLFALLGGAGGLFYLWLWGTVPPEGESEGVVPLRRALTRPAPGADRASSAVVVRAAPAPRADGRPARPAAGPAAAEGGADDGGSQRPGAARRRWPVAELLLGACLLAAGLALVLARLGVELRLELILPALAVLVGVGLTWWQVADRERPDRHQLPRVLGALALVAVGVLMFFVTSRQPSAWTVIAAAVAVLAGVALAVAPWLLRLNRELIAERAGRAREAERSEIAAHLHDSVLQTLALIQQRSEPGSDVARLARGQERELREWLFRSADGAEAPPREAVDIALRAHAAALEVEYPVRFEMVSVGGGVAAPEPVVAAAREAMVNAARHAGGDVTVYVESTPDRIAIDVTDRGPGFDCGALPEGRMGVRESILGRMERAGGTARIVPGPGGTGTSVRLAMPRLQTSDDEPGDRRDGPDSGSRGREPTERGAS